MILKDLEYIVSETVSNDQEDICEETFLSWMTEAERLSVIEDLSVL